MILSTFATLLLYLGTLTWSPPTRDAAHAGSCPIGCVDTTDVPIPVSGLDHYNVYRHRQSPTWASFHWAMQSLPGLMIAMWPTVRAEAAYQYVGSTSTLSFALTDTTRGWWYVVTSVDPAGNESCKSNEVAGPQ